MTIDEQPIPKPTPDRDDRPTRPDGLTIRHLMFLVVACALLMAAVANYWRAALFFVLTLSPVVLVVAVAVILVRRRAAHQETLLRVLTIAADRDVPISTAAEAFGRLGTGGLAARSLGLARTLAVGEPFPRAIQRDPRLLPRTAAALASVGWSHGSLAKGLHEAEASEAHRKLYASPIVSRIAYLILLLFALESVGGFSMYWIMPKFQAIFQDFGVELPGPTQAAIQAGRFLANSGVLALLVLLQIVVVVMLSVAYPGLVRIRPLGASRLLRRVDAAAVLRSLAITVESNRPIGDGLASMGGYYGVGSVRRRLQRARDRIDQGHSWLLALRDVGMLRPADVPILESAERAGNLPWALRTVAASYERRFGRTLQVLAQILMPIIVLSVGSVVALFAVGYFLPLVELIRRLTP